MTNETRDKSQNHHQYAAFVRPTHLFVLILFETYTLLANIFQQKLTSQTIDSYST